MGLARLRSRSSMSLGYSYMLMGATVGVLVAVGPAVGLKLLGFTAARCHDPVHIPLGGSQYLVCLGSECGSHRQRLALEDRHVNEFGSGHLHAWRWRWPLRPSSTDLDSNSNTAGCLVLSLTLPLLPAVSHSCVPKADRMTTTSHAFEVLSDEQLLLGAQPSAEEASRR